MILALPRDRDPFLWCALIAIGFMALAANRLGIPSTIYFDEIHYVTAARHLLRAERFNPEHPMFAKTLIAGSIRLFGDRSVNWRIPSLLFGTVGLYGFGRLMWLTSQRAFATIAAMLLLATGFAWFIQSRIAMLDMVMAGLGMVGLWQFAAACRAGRTGRARAHLAACGVALGLALGSKWSIAPVAVLPGLVFLAARIGDHGRHFLDRADTRPVPGISLAEAALWLGTVPLLAYWLTYLPGFLWPHLPIDWRDPVGWHRTMIALQDSVKKPHPYRSVWWQWVIDYRSVWYLYETVDGARRGIVLVGNPASMWAGLVAFGWCVWAAARRGRRDAAAFAALYFVSLAMWFASGKPVQFYYHYLLPGSFLMGCLALALDDLWTRGGRWRWAALAGVAVPIAVFAWFFPIISAAALTEGKASYVRWMWLHSWR